MTMNTEAFRVKPGKKIDLGKLPTRVNPVYETKEHYKDLLKEQVKELRQLQALLYAHDRYSLLVIFQAMDAAGKDGAIKHVMSGVNPQGCQVFSFKHPSAEELDHDFLWRTTRCLPERGRIGIFNRSYYEEVLIVRVHPEILQQQALPEEIAASKDIWEQRYQSIRELEEHLHRNGTRVIKFFLHLSKEEQKQRFIKRLEDPEKNWKFSLKDVEERKFWKDYMDAYECCLRATSSTHAPWYVIPADDKQNARLLIAQTIVQTMRDLKMTYPRLTAEQKSQLKQARKSIEKI